MPACEICGAEATHLSTRWSLHHICERCARRDNAADAAQAEAGLMILSTVLKTLADAGMTTNEVRIAVDRELEDLDSRDLPEVRVPMWARCFETDPRFIPIESDQ